MLLCGIMTNYTGHILLRCLYLDGGPRINNYPAIGQAAFGNVGRYIVRMSRALTPPSGPRRLMWLIGVRRNCGFPAFSHRSTARRCIFSTRRR